MLVGLTGNFGSGKSTVLSLFEKSGAAVIDSDSIVDTLYADQQIRKQVAALLGNVFNEKGEIDKRKIAIIIFSNNKLKDNLEVLLHHYVFKEIEQSKEKHKKGILVAEIPLLFETGYNANVDKIIVTTCEYDTVLQRLRKKGYTDDEIKMRLRSQMDDSMKKKQADYIIETDNKSIIDIEGEVNNIYNELMDIIK